MKRLKQNYPRTTTTQREPPLTFAVTSRLFLCIYICYIFLNKNSIMLYTLFYKLLFLLTPIVYLSSSVHIGLGFHTGCIAFSAVDVHICVISPHRWTLRVLHLAQDHSCGPVSAYSPHLGLSSEERFLALRVHVIQALLPDGPCRWTPFPAAGVVGEQGGSARCCTLTLCLSPLQG